MHSRNLRPVRQKKGLFFVLALLACSALLPFAQPQAGGDGSATPAFASDPGNALLKASRPFGGSKFVFAGGMTLVAALLGVRRERLLLASPLRSQPAIALRMRQLLLRPLKFASNYVRYRVACPRLHRIVYYSS
ncbi:hypothetical protein IDH44_16025 [Paenibacillus sp. IB182496]|uniref:Uncharacterized protein n=1 Tax=Paenibacillus sabuli TaxID=2772509 RepID=A0A927GSG0_9BACL|nr:hypothetical protein [Paenibacillus sabuli]MBD2846704.1 hypothetical protein [Paenibacillus sabuli]